MSVIRSASNQVIKRVRAVAAGDSTGELILLEGERLVEEALRLGLGVDTLLLASDRSELARELESRGLPVQEVEPELLGRVSRLKTSPGILALVAKPRPVKLDGLPAEADTLLVVAAGISDPGNLGALVRTAEAAGADACVCLAGGASPWNGKALRGSMGSLLRLPVVECATAEACAEQLAARGHRQVRAATRGGAELTGFDWSGPLTLWVSSETGELPAVARDFEGVSIPMAGRAESLNVTAAAAVLLFAAGRTRATSGIGSKA